MMEEVPFQRRDVYVTGPYVDVRLDIFLSKSFPDISRSAIQRYIENGFASVNGVAQKKRTLVGAGDHVILLVPPPSLPDLTPELMAFDILYEDEEIFVVNKPPSLVVHPGPGNARGTFVNGLLAHCTHMEQHDPIRPGIVHRLDKDTSGVLIAAKTQKSLWAISRQFQERSVDKEYLAVVVGRFTESKEVRKPIGRDPVHRKKMAIRDDGKEAHTDFIPLEVCGEASLVKAILHTGRTHQIRVHLQHVGFPVLGDAVYGRVEANKRAGVHRQLLHCHRITFSHPKTNDRITIEALLPHDMQTFFTLPPCCED